MHQFAVSIGYKVDRAFFNLRLYIPRHIPRWKIAVTKPKNVVHVCHHIVVLVQVLIEVLLNSFKVRFCQIADEAFLLDQLLQGVLRLTYLRYAVHDEPEKKVKSQQAEHEYNN